MYSCRSLLVLILLVASFSNRAIAAEALSELPTDAQEDIKTVCLPVQYQEGANAYRQCVDKEVNAYTGKASAPATQLSFDDKYAIQQACSNAGTNTSPSYRICVRQQVAELNAQPAPVTDDLSDDEQYALQQTCFEAQSRLGAGPYRRCINRALDELRQLPAANFTGLSQVAQNGIQLRCSANHQNVVEYRKCLIEAVGGVTASTTTAARTIVQQQREPAVSVDTSTTASVSVIADNTTDSASKPADTTVATIAAASTNESNNNASLALVNTTKTLANGDLVRALPEQKATILPDTEAVALTNRSPASSTSTAAATSTLDSDADGSNDDVVAPESENAGDVSSIEETQPADLRDRAVDAWTQLKSTVLALEGINRTIVLSALALPLLLILGWALLRKRRDHNDDYASLQHNAGLADRVHPNYNTDEHEQLKKRLDAEADEFFSTINAEGIYEDPANSYGNSNSVAMRASRNGSSPDTGAVTEPVKNARQATSAREFDEIFEPQRPATSSDSSAATRIATKPQIAAAAAIHKGFSENGDDSSLSKAADRGAFATWLASVDSDDQLSYAIEFLIYWIAYGDERYDPALKEVLFQLQEPDDRDLIKRWVLKHDVIAFRDAINWLQNNADSVQRRQIVDLLMVVLVNERALTPVQNTMLRFIGDAFGIGNADLDSQYREAFGAAMAPLPRVDKPKWWQRQHETSSLRWDARAAAAETLDVQYRIRLGLELDGPIDEEAVVKGFRRAVRRCHPDRFDALTERERELAEMQFEKFEDARDYLLGVDA